MKTIALFLRVLVGLAILSLFSAQGAQKTEMSPDEHRQALRDIVASLLDKYQNTRISPSSPDNALFEVIGNEARTSPEFVDALINLTAIEEVRPNTTEKLSPERLFPAAYELIGLRDIAESTIRASLVRPNLTARQRVVLGGVIRSIEAIRKRYSEQSPSDTKQTADGESSVDTKSENLGGARRVWPQKPGGNRLTDPSDNGGKIRAAAVAAAVPKTFVPSLLNDRFAVFGVVAAALAGFLFWFALRSKRGK